MANGYFNHVTNVIAAGIRALSAQINNIATEISTGFDKLPTEIELKEGRTRYAVDTGVADAYVVTLPYVPTLTDGFTASFRATNANTGSSTVDYNGTGAKIMRYADGSALALGAVVENQPITTIYNSTSDSHIITSAGSQVALPLVGIRSTATGERVLITDTGLVLGVLGSDYTILNAATDGILRAFGGDAVNEGGGIRLYSDLHATKPGDVELLSDANVFLSLDESTGILTVLTGIGGKTLALTINASQLATFAGGLTVEGAFTSLGIDDNAPGERLGIGDNTAVFGTAGATYNLVHAATDQLLQIAGDLNGSGGEISLHGSAHASDAGDVFLRSQNEIFFHWDESTGTLKLYTDSGVKTLALTIDSSQVVDFANPPTADGIQFPPVQVPSADVNCLDDYEEEEFTVTLTPGTSGTITLQTGSDTLAYTKVGRVCHVQGRLAVDSVSSPVGSVAVGPLPFTTATLSESADTFITPVLCHNLGVLSDGFHRGQIDSADTVIRLHAIDNTAIADDFQASTIVYFNFSYITA